MSRQPTAADGTSAFPRWERVRSLGRPRLPWLPDHGELWSAPWSSSVYDHAGGTTLAGRTEGTVFHYEFEREVTLDKNEPVARFRYRVRNLGDKPFPWIWSSHPLLNVQPGSTLTLHGVEQVRIDAVHGRDDLEVGAVVGWPSAIGGTAGHFTFPETGAWAAKLFGRRRCGRPYVAD